MLLLLLFISSQCLPPVASRYFMKADTIYQASCMSDTLMQASSNRVDAVINFYNL